MNLNSDTGVRHVRSIRSFVVRRARLNDSHRRAIEQLSPEYVLPPETREIFDRFERHCERKVFEIGFGMGYATAQYAMQNADTSILGSEVYPPGVGKLLIEISRLGLENVRIVRADAIDVLGTGIRDEELDAVHIFFPDPWPKKRHHKRRLIQRDFVHLVASRLKAGGTLYIATDWAGYAEHIAEVLGESEEFGNFDPLPEDARFSSPRGWRPQTAFERKGLAKGHTVREFYFRKR